MKSDRDTFFDTNPVRYAFSEILLRRGFSITYKPREVMFRKQLDKLGITSSSKVLDVGSGDGILLERISTTYGASGVGVDVSKESIKRSTNRFKKNKKTSYKVSRAEKLPFADNSFDVVVSFDTLEHVGDPADIVGTQKAQINAIKEMVRVLKQGGGILIYTINKNQGYTFNQMLSRFGIDIYSDFDHYHLLFPDPQNVKKTLTENGVSVSRITLYNSFFTLAADAFIVLVNQRLGGIKNAKLQLLMARVLHFISIVFLPLLSIMDLPWTLMRKSNSFFVRGRKIS